MSDTTVAKLLRSNRPLVVIEAPAGCGKTHQGAALARDIARSLGHGRLLILTHTHAACSVFAERTTGAGSKVEIRTIDALIAQIATSYHKTLDLPANVSAWAWQDNGKGFETMATKVATFLNCQPMVARVLACRYPFIICDEHQDSTADQHSIVMALHQGGATLRVFGDPLQRIHGVRTDKAAREDRGRWESLKSQAAFGKLEYPHRWDKGCSELGRWVLSARKSLEDGQPIDLTASLPVSLCVLMGDNSSPQPRGYQLPRSQRNPIDRLVRSADELMILASQNDLVTALRSFWYRSIPIWEGHTRPALAALVGVLREESGDAEALARGLVAFVGGTAVGFSRSTHGDRLLHEIRERCARPTTGKPANIQKIARRIIDEPSLVGVAAAIKEVGSLVERKEAGFDKVKIDHRVEFRDAIRLGEFADPDEAFAEIARKRSYSRPSPPRRFLSSIAKAKGLECESALVMACDQKRFGATIYSRCKMYVALSRAKRSLTLVIPATNPSALFKLSRSIPG